MALAGSATTPWRPWQLNLFRFAFIFLLILIIPVDWKFYSDLYHTKWASLHVYELLKLSKYMPDFFALKDHQPEWGLKSFSSWGLAALIAIAGAFIWRKQQPDKKEYVVLYYWLRVLVRYRLAIALFAYGFIKLFPLQMPYPSLSNLLTNYGDFFSWKIYFQTLGIEPKYESFLGFVEILAAVLLFNRKTTAFGAGLIIGFLGNVAAANGFYDIGEHVFSTFIVLLSVFLLVYDVPKLYTLLIKEKKGIASKFKPVFSEPVLKRIRFFGKSFTLLFALLFGSLALYSFIYDPYKVPKTPGLTGAYGFYNVKDFVINGDTIPYSKTDSTRWQDVVFEKWSTISVNVNKPLKIDLSSGDGYFENDIDRNYEIAGLSGRRYFYYKADTINKKLLLQNKNKNYRYEKLNLSYTIPSDSVIILSGINERNDSIHVRLEKNNKKILMKEGRRRPVNI
ncbi:hypothetical protein A8C56_10965 [Niabella ginsenosidivorans]|uniref:DoxX family protein n=1 Tax=Niabella ginsenosidivorans TaxID=1176587 RepID=A0A1A9IB06_9BACT|nr:hypothetical protein A8C56_10965 [Niabella ginsenosidivorans]